MTKPYCTEHIPHELLSIKAHDDFLKWLASLPLSPIERKCCLLAWANELHYTVTQADILFALAELAPKEVIKATLKQQIVEQKITPAKAAETYKATLKDQKAKK